jgi:hypothetical protein
MIRTNKKITSSSANRAAAVRDLMLGQRGGERHREADVATMAACLIGSLCLEFVRRHFK